MIEKYKQISIRFENTLFNMFYTNIELYNIIYKDVRNPLIPILEYQLEYKIRQEINEEI